MKIIEKLPEDLDRRPIPPYKLAIGAAVAVVVLLVAGFLVPANEVGLRFACWLPAGVLLLYLIIIGGAFALDANRRRHGGGDLRSR